MLKGMVLFGCSVQISENDLQALKGYKLGTVHRGQNALEALPGAYRVIEPGEPYLR